MITLPDLHVILPLSELSALSVILGGTRDLALLPKFRKLEKLMLMRITKMSDLGVLAELTGLKKLHLDWMRNVTTLPSLAPLDRLKRVRLDTMKGLTDLAPVAAAPALRELSVTNMPQLRVENFRCLIGHPHLERLWAYVGRQKSERGDKAPASCRCAMTGLDGRRHRIAVPGYCRPGILPSLAIGLIVRELQSAIGSNRGARRRPVCQ